MNKLIVVPIIAWIIWATTPSKTTIESTVTISPIIDNTKSRVLSVLPENELLKQFIIPDKKNYEKDALKERDNTLLFPLSVQTIWLERLSEGLLWNMSKWWLVEGINPLMVDVEWEDEVNCAATMKSIIAFSKNPLDRSLSEDKYVRKKWIDAWILPEELKKVWYNQAINLMKYFDKNRIWNPDIVWDKEGYKKWLLETWNYLKNNWKIWSMLFIYFNLSDYTWVVKNYNDQQKRNDSNYSVHFNTHQAMFLWNSFMEFKAWDIKVVGNEKLYEMDSDVEITDYIANFVQYKWWYKSSLSNNTKKVIKDNIKTFYPLIEISVNWEIINLEEEIKKTIDSRIKINKDDNIKITWPVFVDWFHNKNSKNRYISDNNHARPIFYFEFVLIWTYTPSELMEPNDDFYERKWNKNPELQSLTDYLKISNLYYLKRWENIDFKLNEAILRFKFWKQKLLEETTEEIELINKIQEAKGSKNYNELIQKAISIREEKLKSIISSLTNEEKREFEKEYGKQINWLQMIWYMQHEWLINDWAVYINRFIPFFDTENIEVVFKWYIDQRKQELSYQNSKKCHNCPEEKYTRVYFYPTDNSTKIFNQLESNLQKYIDKYPIFSKIKDLNVLKRNKFLDLVIDKISDDKNIDISNWKIPSMRSIVIPLDYINSVLLTIFDETYVEELPLSDIDNEIIMQIAKTPEDYNYLSYIITKENYEIWIPVRKFSKKIGALLDKTSSFWDYQLRFNNLKDKDASLKEWPNVDQIKKAISCLDTPILKKIIDRRLKRFEDVVVSDLSIIEQLKGNLDSINEENRLEKGKNVFELLKVLFRFNDTREINIIWKIIQASLSMDKIHEHFYNINWWLENSWVSLEEIYYNKDLQTRYAKTLLVVHNQAEKKALIWIAESYILRLLESMWDNIRHQNYPRLDKNLWFVLNKFTTWYIESNWDTEKNENYLKLIKSLKWMISWQIDYDEKVIKEHFNYLKDRLSLVISDDESIIDVRNEINREITNILNWNLSAKDIYKLFKNKKIKGFLENNWYDKYPFPTIEEFDNTPFREVFFTYTKTPNWRTPPKIYDFEKIFKQTGSILGWLISVWIGWFFVKRKRKKKIENKKVETNEVENKEIEEDFRKLAN